MNNDEGNAREFAEMIVRWKAGKDRGISEDDLTVWWVNNI